MQVMCFEYSKVWFCLTFTSIVDDSTCQRPYDKNWHARTWDSCYGMESSLLCNIWYLKKYITIFLWKVWATLMNSVEWNKKADLVGDQAVRHLKQYAPLLLALTNAGKSQLLLMQKIQEYCYDNMNFIKVFQKIIILFYKCKFLQFFFCICS